MKQGKKEKQNMIERRERVRELMLNGLRKPRMVEIVMSEFGVSLATIETDLTQVYKELKEYTLQHAQDVVADHVGKYDMMYAKCLEMFDFKDAAKILRQKEDLLRLHKTDPLVVNNTTVRLDNVSDDVLLQALTKLNELK